VTAKGQKHGTYTIILGKPLSPREREILLNTALGLTAVQIGNKLGISDKTVRRHRQNIYVKMGVYSALEAVTQHLVTDEDFYDGVKKAVLEGRDKPDGNNRGGSQPGGYC
jgi:DNA-binding CsgD family transcriptional regulator